MLVAHVWLVSYPLTAMQSPIESECKIPTLYMYLVYISCRERESVVFWLISLRAL